MIEIQALPEFDGAVLRDQLSGAGLPVKENPLSGGEPDILVVNDMLRFNLMGEEHRETLEAILADHAQLVIEAEATRGSRRQNDTSITTDLLAALEQNKADRAENDTFLALATPTANQVDRHIKALTRQSSRQARMINGIIRKQLGMLEAID